MTETIERLITGRADWSVCAGCRSLIYGKRLTRNLGVCPECGRHERLTAHERIDQLLDGATVEILDFPVAHDDPLEFTDTIPYPQRLERARRGSGLTEAVVCAKGFIDERPVIAAVMDFRFLGGSLGSAAGELITRAAELALRERTPLLIVTASGGARMQEGTLALMQMAKTAQALGQLDQAGILTISLITDPTFGGVAASFATLCDVIIAEPGARMGFAGPRVIEQTIKQTLPPGFQTAEFLLKNGLLDLVRPRAQLRTTLAGLLSVGARQHGGDSAEWVELTPDLLVRRPSELAEQDAWDAVRRARNLRRPTTTDYFARMLTYFEELHGDRLGEDCPAIVGGFGRLGGIPVIVIGHQKGHSIGELTARNFGMASPAGYRKAARLMRLASKLGLPVVTLVDTPGAYPGLTAEQHGQSVAIAENLRLMAGLPVPVVTVVTGEGGSGGALALAVSDQVLIWENAVYSVITPEGCAAILWKDATAAPRAAAALRVDARQLLQLGIVDAVIREPEGGVEDDHLVAAQRLQAAVLSTLRSLTGLDPADLINRRRRRLRGFGSTVVRPADSGGDNETRWLDERERFDNVAG